MARRFFDDQFSLTKAHLGALMIVAGIGLAAVMVAVEFIGTDSAGLGVIQWIGILGGAASAMIGITLLPLGDYLA